MLQQAPIVDPGEQACQIIANRNRPIAVVTDADAAADANALGRDVSLSPVGTIGGRRDPPG